MKKIMLLSLLFFSCANSSSDSKPAVAIDFTGTWNFTSVQCYDSTLTTQTAVATPSNGFTEVISVTAGQYTATDTFGGCSVGFAGDLVFGDTTLNITNRRVIFSTGGSCAITLALSGGGITPASSTTTYSNQSLPSVTNAPFYYNPTLKLLGLPSAYTNGVAGNVCFVVYQKQ